MLDILTSSDAVEEEAEDDDDQGFFHKMQNPDVKIISKKRNRPAEETENNLFNEQEEKGENIRLNPILQNEKKKNFKNKVNKVF